MDSDGYMCFIPPNREKRYVNQEIHGDTRGYNTVEMIQVNFFQQQIVQDRLVKLERSIRQNRVGQCDRYDVMAGFVEKRICFRWHVLWESDDFL